jgi:hypothetical protein
MNFSQRFKFSDWPNRDIPLVAAGAYAIWHGDELIYCGMSGREIEKAVKANKKKYGLVTRLNSHAQGRLSGNQFCVYVANRLVIPTLSIDDLSKFATGEFKLDYMTKSYIHNNLEYQYLIVDSSSEAYRIEDKARTGEVFNQKPLLNPM